MKARFLSRALCIPALLTMLAGCATQQAYDYTNFRAHPPRSILVMPPLNESTTVEGTYSYLSTVTMPLAEMGFYVFPVVLVDQFLKENGLPSAGEMHQIPLDKIRSVFGADAVLYVVLKQYGSKYQIFNSATIVSVEARLVDTRSGLVLWNGAASAQQNSSGSGSIASDLIAAVITQTVNASSDQAHEVSRLANAQLLTTKDYGLLYGPYHPQEKQP